MLYAMGKRDQAIVNVLLNRTGLVDVGTDLSSYREFTVGLTPEMRGIALDEVKKVGSFAYPSLCHTTRYSPPCRLHLFTCHSGSHGTQLICTARTVCGGGEECAVCC